MIKIAKAEDLMKIGNEYNILMGDIDPDVVEVVCHHKKYDKARSCYTNWEQWAKYEELKLVEEVIEAL